MRLDAACAEALGISRKECRDGIRRGCVSINGKTEKRPEAQIDRTCRIFWEQEELDLREHYYIQLYKPAGTVCTTDPIPESVLKLMPQKLRKRLFCVGRLDKDTTGLLLLTDDGNWDHRLMSPKHHAVKEYEATLEEPLPEEQKQQIEVGLLLENGEKTRPCRVENNGTICRIWIQEGKYHQIKRMFAAVGNRVTALHRIAIGDLRLDPELLPGEWRELTEEEIHQAEKSEQTVDK